MGLKVFAVTRSSRRASLKHPRQRGAHHPLDTEHTNERDMVDGDGLMRHELEKTSLPARSVLASGTTTWRCREIRTPYQTSLLTSEETQM